jgi:hypothetical protein
MLIQHVDCVTKKTQVLRVGPLPFDIAGERNKRYCVFQIGRTGAFFNGISCQGPPALPLKPRVAPVKRKTDKLTRDYGVFLVGNDMWGYRVRLNGAGHQWGKDPPKEVVG